MDAAVPGGAPTVAIGTTSALAFGYDAKYTGHNLTSYGGYPLEISAAPKANALGEPLAKPFADQPSSTISGNQYVISTRSFRHDRRFAIQYRADPTSDAVGTLDGAEPADHLGRPTCAQR